ncbi:hypothetical protein HAX54_012797 [Datura stramonium]|uniref:SKP1-like protein n=1 Tax=Datura stramonium TaxID=4076 RepID=A0ABS8TN40_DATST|nr:hypothetical protein [Datura stramonium]
MSQAIKNMVQDDCASNVIPLPNVDGKTMTKVIEYGTKHSEKKDKDYLKLHHSVLYDLLSIILMIRRGVPWVMKCVDTNDDDGTVIELESFSSFSLLLTLRTSDGEVFEIDEAVAVRSQAIKNMVEDDCASNVIPLPNVDSKTMSKVIEYWVKHSEKKGVSEDQLMAFDKDYWKVHHSVLYNVLLAASYLNDKKLMNVICQEVADRIKGKTPEEIRKKLDIKNDFTPEEEAQIDQEIDWASK